MATTTEIDIVIASNLSRLLSDDHGAQVELAKKCGVTPNTINRIIKIRQHAGPSVVRDIAKALGVREIDLYQEYDPSESAAERARSEALALKLKEYNEAMADAGKHMTAMLNEIAELKAKLASQELYSAIPADILEKLTRIDWRKRGIIAVVKLALKPFVKPSHDQSQTRKSAGIGNKD
jgi:transcriptional regulator with XRE-family HTH domain